MSEELPSLFDAIDSARYELLWPHADRKIYCSVSGRPYGVLHEDEVASVISGILKLPLPMQLPAIQTQIDHMYAFQRPSPLWHSITPHALKANRERDVPGLTVFLLNRLFCPRGHGADVSNVISWRKAQCQAWQAINRTLPELRQLLLNLCNTLMLLDADGYLPPPDVLPWRTLSMAADRNNIYTMHRTLQYHFMEYKQRRKANTSWVGMQPVHAPGPGNIPGPSRLPSPIMRQSVYNTEDPIVDKRKFRDSVIRIALLQFEKAFNPIAGMTPQDLGEIMVTTRRTITVEETVTVQRNGTQEPPKPPTSVILKPGQAFIIRRKGE